MQIDTLHHVSLQVADLERAGRFYEEVLGLKRLPRPDLAVAGIWLALGDRELHLIAEGPATPAHPLDIRHTHLAIRVPSYAAALDHLRRQGFREDAPPADPRRILTVPNSRVGYPQLYIQDPDGHMIEINAARLDG